MDYFKRSINFLSKNFLVIIPLYIAIVIPLFFAGMAMNQVMAEVQPILQSIISGGEISDPMAIVQRMMGAFQRAAGSSSLATLLTIVLALIVQPATAGLIKKGIEGEETGLQFFVDALKENFIQFLLFAIGVIIILIAAVIGIFLVLLIFGFLAGALKTVGAIIFALVLIALVIFGIYFGVRIFSLWFPSMVIDRAGMFEGMKKGFEASKGSFWLIFLVFILISIAMGLVTWILGFLNRVVIIGPLVLGAVSALGQFILFVFCMIVYKEKSQGTVEPAPES
jgi:hypothetical protein